MLEDGSSSPNDSLRIVSFERHRSGGFRGAPGRSKTEKSGGTRERRWKLQLSDGSSFFVSDECLHRAGISPWELTAGVELETALVDRLHECSRALEARSKAVELLARRAHSAEEVRRKLLQRRFDTRHIDEALAWLDERGYLNDRAFAREWVERRVERHPEGRLALIAGLRRRGVSREVAEEVIASLCTPESERAWAEAALDGLRRHDKSPEPSEDRLRRALQRRGFGSSLILELLRERPSGSGVQNPGSD